jgi:hypothetical protein
MNLLKYIRLKRSYNKRKKEEYSCDYIMGAGYYDIPIKNGIKEFEMKSGKIGIYKLLDCDNYHDPSDMIKKSYWQFLGYKGEKLFTEMTFQDYLDFREKN